MHNYFYVLRVIFVVIVAVSLLFISNPSHAIFIVGKIVQFIPKGTTPPPPATPCPVDQYVIAGFLPGVILFPSGMATGLPRLGKYMMGIYVPAPIPPCIGSAFITAGFGR